MLRDKAEKVHAAAVFVAAKCLLGSTTHGRSGGDCRNALRLEAAVQRASIYAVAILLSETRLGR